LETITTIHFIRHGLVHNPQRIYYGRLPRFGLSETGRAQAARAGAYMAGKPLDVIFTSPMLRARQTAALVRGERRIPLRVSQLLNEVRSPYDGQPWRVLEERDYDVYTGSGPEFEQPADVLERMLRFVARARREFAGGSVAAVSHGSPLAIIHDWARGIGQPRSTHTLQGHAAVMTLIFHTDYPEELPRIAFFDPNG